MLALHPEVMALNHGLIRIFQNQDNDFITDATPEKLDSFIAEARELAQAGEQGPMGGHTLHSHAFQDPTLRDAYLSRYGWEEKPGMKCLLWKDATRVTNRLIRNRIDPADVATKLPMLRFLLMLRNPVDIAISSVNKNYSVTLVGEKRKNDSRAVFINILKRFSWFGDAANVNPRQFRIIFQDELLDRPKLDELCSFLGIARDPAWLDQVAELIQLRPSYHLPDTVKEELRALTRNVIPDPNLARRVADQIV